MYYKGSTTPKSDLWPRPVWTMLSCSRGPATRQDHEQVRFSASFCPSKDREGAAGVERNVSSEKSWNGHVSRCKIKIRMEVSPPPASCIVLDRFKSYLPNRDCSNHQDLIFWETVLSPPFTDLQTMNCFTVYLKTCTHLQTSTCPAFLCSNNFLLQVLVPACRIECWTIVCLTLYLVCIIAFYFLKEKGYIYSIVIIK